MIRPVCCTCDSACRDRRIRIGRKRPSMSAPLPGRSVRWGCHHCDPVAGSLNPPIVWKIVQNLNFAFNASSKNRRFDVNSTMANRPPDSGGRQWRKKGEKVKRPRKCSPGDAHRRSQQTICLNNRLQFSPFFKKNCPQPPVGSRSPHQHITSDTDGV